MKGNCSVSVYTGSSKLEIQIGSLSRNPRNAYREISLQLSGPHSERATARRVVRRIMALLKSEEKKKSRFKTKFCIYTNFLLQSRDSFWDFIHEEILMRFSGFSRIPRGSANSVLSISVDEKLRARCLVLECSLLRTKYSLMMVSRGEVLGARRCSVARIAAV